MLRMEVEPSTRMVLVYLDVAERQRLLEVLCDWLSRYAGIACAAPPIEEVCWILELRRLLLSPDEPRCAHGSEPVGQPGT